MILVKARPYFQVPRPHQFPLYQFGPSGGILKITGEICSLLELGDLAIDI